MMNKFLEYVAFIIASAIFSFVVIAFTVPSDALIEISKHNMVNLQGLYFCFCFGVANCSLVAIKAMTSPVLQSGVNALGRGR